MGRLIVVVFGLMGSGKSSRSRALGSRLNWPVIHSDAVRKTLAGLAPTTRVPVEFGAGIYGQEFSEGTYAEMHRLAGEHLKASPGVILDASYTRAAARAFVRDLAQEAGAEALLVLCECPPEVARGRLGIRRDDPRAISNGRVELFEAQAQDFDPLMPEDRPLLRLDTGRKLAVVLDELQAFVESYLE